MPIRKRAWAWMRRHGRRMDAWVLLLHTAAFLLLLWNCWAERVALTLAATMLPLAVMAYWALRDGAVRRAVAFGAGVGLLWPFGEGVVVRTVGWWGRYDAPAWRLWDTPAYCIAIGWLASAYIAYWAFRIEEAGLGRRWAAAAAGLNALFLGALGENMFVWAGMWTYDPAAWQLGAIPLFVPVAYGAVYALIPTLNRLPMLLFILSFNSVLAASCLGFGFLVGFFPR